MQVSFDTDKPAEVALARLILNALPGAPVAPPSAGTVPVTPQAPRGIAAGFQVPANAPAGSYWGPGDGPGGLPGLYGPDDQRIPVQWRKSDSGTLLPEL